MSPDSIARRGRRPGDLRVVVRRPTKLPRTLGAPALFAAAYGNVGSSIYYALGVTALFALGLTPLALLLAGGIFVTTALNYAEGTAAIPHAGGSSSFARRAFNDPIGFLVGWVQLLNYMATVSISSYFAISYLGVFGRYVPFFELLKTSDVWHVGATIVLIGFLIVINIIGIQESSALNLALALADLVTQFVLVILGLVLLLNIRTVINNIHWGIAPTWGNFLASISIAMVTYTGIETISNLSEEAKNPGRSVPRATYGVIVAVLFVAAFLPTIGLSVFPVHPDGHGGYISDLATTWKADPVAGIVTGFVQPLAFWAGMWVGFLAFTILLIATNAGLIGISRLSYSLAGAEMLPRRFAMLHPKFKTPYISIVVFGILAAVLVLPGIIVGSKEIDLMSAVYSLAATFAFCSAHLSVMRLRFIEPELYRPYRMPFNIKFGRDSIPVLSLVGALAIGTVFTQLIFQNITNSTWIYLGWMGLGVVSFVLYRRHRKQPIWEPLEVPPPPDREVEHLPPEPMPQIARYRHGRRERIAAHAAHPAAEPQRRHRHRRSWSVGWELYWKRHGNVRGALIVVVFAAVSGLAVFVDLSPFDPTGPGMGWSPGIIVVALIAAYLLNRSHLEQ